MEPLPCHILITNVSGSGSIPETFVIRSEEHTSELQSLTNLVCRLLLEKKKQFEELQPLTNLVRLLLPGATLRTPHNPRCTPGRTNPSSPLPPRNLTFSLAPSPRHAVLRV